MKCGDCLPGTLPGHLAATLIALVRVHTRDGRATVRAVAREAGRSAKTVHDHLHALAGLGLVAGLGDGTKGALRPRVQVLVPA